MDDKASKVIQPVPLEAHGASSNNNSPKKNLSSMLSNIGTFISKQNY